MAIEDLLPQVPTVTRAAIDEYYRRLLHVPAYMADLITRIERDNPELFDSLWSSSVKTEEDRNNIMTGFIRTYALVEIQLELNAAGGN